MLALAARRRARASALVDPRPSRGGPTPAVAALALERVIYELHVGTFTPEGTFAGAAARLPALRDLGVTVVELMPVAQFPGSRNWGYDGAALFAPARAYGGPDDLRRFVDAAHGLGLAVMLDVVYNHFGPDGAYVLRVQPVLQVRAAHETRGARRSTSTAPHAMRVRAFFVENALHWLHEYHVDGLRLDATHALVDDGPRTPAARADRRRAGPRTRPRRCSWSPKTTGTWRRSCGLRRRAAGAATPCGPTTSITDAAAARGRPRRLLRGFRPRRPARKGVRRPFVVRRRLLRVSAPALRRAGRRVPPERSSSPPEPRPGRQPRVRRSAAARARPLAAFCTLLSPFVPLLFMGEEYGELSPVSVLLAITSTKRSRPRPRAGRRSQFAGFRVCDGGARPGRRGPFCALRARRARMTPGSARLTGELIAARRMLAPGQADAAPSYDELRPWAAGPSRAAPLAFNFCNGPLKLAVSFTGSTPRSSSAPEARPN